MGGYGSSLSLQHKVLAGCAVSGGRLGGQVMAQEGPLCREFFLAGIGEPLKA